MKVLNFDKFVQEKDNEMIQVIFHGREYKVAPRIPAVVPIMMSRAENSGDKQAATRAVMKAADVMFGSKAVDQMCDDGISAQEIADLIQRLFNMINGADGDEDDDSEELTDEDSRKAVGNGSNAKK